MGMLLSSPFTDVQDLEYQVRHFNIKPTMHFNVDDARDVVNLYHRMFDHVPERIQHIIRRRFPSQLYQATNELTNLFDFLREEIDRAQIQAGEPVGLIAAQSIGEQATQKTLDTFHGKDHETQSTPRIRELLNGKLTDIHVPRFTIPFPSRDEAARYCNNVVARPMVQSWKPWDGSKTPW
jgi:hypothetical protein